MKAALFVYLIFWGVPQGVPMTKWIVAILVLAFNLHAGEHTKADNIWTAVEKAEALSKKYDPSRVVFASDLDNTLLKTHQDLASEPWFNWQDSLLKEQSTSEHRIACDVPDLLHFFYTTIALSQLSPVQDDQHEALEYLQASKIATIAVTARGESVASQTFRELNKNKLDFSKTSLAGKGYPNPHLPYNLKDLAASGLTQSDVEKFSLSEARPVLYQRGVMFSDGQNKGILLKTLVHKTKRDIKAIVFFDNDKKNTQRVFDTFDGGPIEVISIRASRMDRDIQRFNDSDKTKVTQDFLVLRKLLDDTYFYPRPCQLPIDKLKP